MSASCLLFCSKVNLCPTLNSLEDLNKFLSRISLFFLFWPVVQSKKKTFPQNDASTTVLYWRDGLFVIVVLSVMLNKRVMMRCGMFSVLRQCSEPNPDLYSSTLCLWPVWTLVFHDVACLLVAPDTCRYWTDVDSESDQNTCTVHLNHLTL